MAHITCDGHITKIDGLVSDDRALALLLGANEEAEWGRLVERALGVGAHGLVTMGLDVGLGAVREQVRHEVDEAIRLAETRVSDMLESAEQAYREQFDPDQRSSLLSRSLREFHQWQTAFFASMDVDQSGSLGGRLVHRLEELVGRGGILESQLADALDVGTDGSALGSLRRDVLSEIRELRDALHAEQGRRAEAEVGTRKGFDFEDVIEERARAWAAGIGGCLVERTSTSGGALGREALVGDLVLTMPDGYRIVVEAKHTNRITLTGDGILTELDRAITNREAEVAICVSAAPAYPAEVGTFAVYGRRILVVDDGTEALFDVALRVAVLIATTARPTGAEGIDRAALSDQLERIGQLARRFSSTKRTLTEAQNSIEVAKQGLDSLRNELVDLTEAATLELRTGSPT